MVDGSFLVAMRPWACSSSCPSSRGSRAGLTSYGSDAVTFVGGLVGVTTVTLTRRARTGAPSTRTRAPAVPTSRPALLTSRTSSPSCSGTVSMPGAVLTSPAARLALRTARIPGTRLRASGSTTAGGQTGWVRTVVASGRRGPTHHRTRSMPRGRALAALALLRGTP